MDTDNYLCQLVFEIISDWQIQCCQINDLTKYQDHPLIKPSLKVGWAFFGLFAARFIDVVVVAVCPRLQQLSLATPFAVLFLLLFSLFTIFFFFWGATNFVKGQKQTAKKSKENIKIVLLDRLESTFCGDHKKFFWLSWVHWRCHLIVEVLHYNYSTACWNNQVKAI